MKTHRFKELVIWQRAMQLAKDIYAASRQFPKSEVFGLTSQIRRTAVSIPSNIAEGCGRGTPRQLIQYCSVAQGSAFELETQVLLAKELNLLDDPATEKLQIEIEEIQRMIHGFINRASNNF